MGTIHIKELSGGLDVRRLPETTPGGVLVRGDNGHITRGSEFESRAAFVPQFDFPAGTVGLAHTRTGLVTFGSGEAPAGMPIGVQYVRLQKSGLVLEDIIDWELFENKIYVVALFNGGVVAHFYDGTEVTAWQEARARASIQVGASTVTPAVRASGTFNVLGGTPEILNRITSLQVAGTELLSAPVTARATPELTAQAIADEINDNPTAPKYIASVSGAQVTLTADRAGAAANGRAITWTLTGNFALGGATALSGGADTITPTLTNLTIGGVRVVREPVLWAGSIEATAEAIADEITRSVSNPDYEAFVEGGNSIIVRSVTAGADANGRAIVPTVTGGLNLTFPGGASLAGGAALENNRYTPADVVLTVKEKVYAGAGSLLHMSAVQNPAHWAPGGTGTTAGAGFKNISISNSSSYKITGLARYLEKLAVFTPDTVQTWFIDPNPDLVVQTQVLENTGTECPRSVTQFGDSDIFYLDSSGLRSLRARDSSNAAATTDVGVPIDDLLSAKLAVMSQRDKNNIHGLINPADKRFWLIMGTEIFVYSYYPSSKVNAWTRYEISTPEPDGSATLHSVSDALVFDGHVFLRAGNRVFCYGGWGRAQQYDATKAVAWLPMLDANLPTGDKDWTAVDVAATGEWDISVSYDPKYPEVMDPVATVACTTFSHDRVPMKNRSTHVGLRLVSRGGHVKLSALVIHFRGKADED